MRFLRIRFVIMQCFNNLDQHDSLKKTKMGTIPERIALTLKNAGVSITLTSLTDIAAFGVGCLSVSIYLIYSCKSNNILCAYK